MAKKRLVRWSLTLGVPSCPGPPGARPEEAQEPSWGAAAKGAALCACCGAAAAMRPLALHAAEVVVEYLRLPLLVERVLRGEDGVVWTAAGRARAGRLDVLTPREVVGVWP